MKFRTSIITLGATLFCAPAFAQDMAPAQPATPAQTTPAPAPATPPPAAPATSATITDAEIAQFATAALAVDKVTKDTTIAAADKNAKMAEAVTAAGLDPNRFNAISQAMQADPALNTRIQKAAAAQQPVPAAPAPAPK